MIQQRSSLAFIVLVVFSLLILVGLGWANYHIASDGFSGNGFFIQWIGIRAMLTGGTDPYEDQVTQRIQRVVDTADGFAEGPLARFTSPIYSGIIVLPFALIEDDVLAHTLWLTAQLVFVFITILMAVRLTGWKIAWYAFFFITLFTVFSYHVLLPWMDGGLPIWVTGFLVLFFLSIRAGREELAGVLLALTAIQPQMVILLLVFILFWVISQRKRLMILWFLGTLVSLSIIGVLLAPGWILQYLRILFNYSANFPPGTPGVIFQTLWPGLGKQISWVFSGILAIILLIEWWLARRKDFRWFLWTACLTLVISQWIGIPTIPGNFIGLVLPLVLISAMLSERWPRGGPWVMVVVCILLFVWEWALFITDLSNPEPQMQLNLLFPLPLVLLIGLYWVRWWAIKPRRLLMEELRLSETY